MAANATASTVGKGRNAKYGLRNASWRIVPATDIVAKAFVFANVDGAEIIAKTVSSFYVLNIAAHALPTFIPCSHFCATFMSKRFSWLPEMRQELIFRAFLIISHCLLLMVRI